MNTIKTSRWRTSLFAIALLGILLPPWIGRFLENKAEAAFQLLPSPAIDRTVYGLINNSIVTFNAFAPGAVSAPVPITGLQTGEMISSIDYRPLNADLFGVSNQSRIYTINPVTGAATQVGATPFTPALTGAAFIDFNPQVDRLRVVGGVQNLRIVPGNGAVAATAPADMPLTFATGDPNAGKTPNVVAAAYTNNFLGATGTTLYDIDATTNSLVTQGTAQGVTPAVSPNLGQLLTVGSLGLTLAAGTSVGFDITSVGFIGFKEMAFASLTPTGATTPSFYTINLQTGAASLIGVIGGATPVAVTDVAVVTRVITIFAIDNTGNLLTFNAGKSSTGVLTRPLTG